MYSSDIFYNKFADSYADYATTKIKYLSAVDAFIKNESMVFGNLADIGSGDGRRAKRIADIVGVNDVTLIDNSKCMIDLAKKNIGVKVMHADIASPKFKIDKKFKTVLCLWNVLGHVSSVEGRMVALKNIEGMMSRDSILFLDVNNRYNMAHYGLMSVLKNIIKDFFIADDLNGDFDLNFNTEEGQIHTKVHIFNPTEIEYLIKNSRTCYYEEESNKLQDWE